MFKHVSFFVELNEAQIPIKNAFIVIIFQLNYFIAGKKSLLADL